LSAAPRSRPRSTCCKNLVKQVDALVIGGGMANTFLAAKASMSASRFASTISPAPPGIMTAAAAAGCAIVLPIDAVVAREFKAGADNETVDVDAIPPTP
jgi:phosphoglycerate kinase